jgi:hypothetical protein
MQGAVCAIVSEPNEQAASQTSGSQSRVVRGQMSRKPEEWAAGQVGSQTSGAECAGVLACWRAGVLACWHPERACWHPERVTCRHPEPWCPEPWHPEPVLAC